MEKLERRWGMWGSGRQITEMRLLIGRCTLGAWPRVDPAIIGYNCCRQPRAASDAADHAFLATFTNHCPSPSSTPNPTQHHQPRIGRVSLHAVHGNGVGNFGCRTASLALFFLFFFSVIIY